MKRKGSVRKTAGSGSGRRALEWVLAAAIVAAASLFVIWRSATQVPVSDGELILERLSGSEADIIVNSTVDEGRVVSLAGVPFDELKRRLGVKRDFVVYFIDESGEVIEVGGRKCIGTPKVSVDGEKCGS